MDSGRGGSGGSKSGERLVAVHHPFRGLNRAARRQAAKAYASSGKVSGGPTEVPANSRVMRGGTCRPPRLDWRFQTAADREEAFQSAMGDLRRASGVGDEGEG